MPTFFHGNDEGGVLLLAAAAIMILSMLCASLLPRINAKAELAKIQFAHVVEQNEEINKSLRMAYDLH